MTQTSLRVSVQPAGGPAAALTLDGAVTAEAEAALFEAMGQAAGRGARSLLIDFSRVAGIDSGGASALVKLWAESKSRGIRLFAAAPDAGLRQILDLTQLSEAMPVFDSLAPALSAMGVAAGSVPSGESRVVEVSRDATAGAGRGRVANWARPVKKLRWTRMPGAISSLNLEGRRPVGPVKGFGQMWEKTYELRIPGANKTPSEITAIMKGNFVSFQPPQNKFYPSLAGIVAGETVLIKSSTMGIPIYTGVLTSYADDVSFTFMTPQGHPESGWVTFRVFPEAGQTVCQIQGLARANDPVFEIAFRLHGSKFQEQIWKHVLASLGRHLDVSVPVTMKKRCVAPNLQWGQAVNIWYDAQIRTLVYIALWPLRRVAAIFQR